MNRIFVAVDGDDIGQKVGQSVLHDDPKSLAEISQRLSAGLDTIKQWTDSHQGQVVSMGGDEGVLMFDNIQDEDAFLDEIESLRQAYEQTTGATLTVGSGLSLSQAGKALLAGKLSGKNMLVPYGQEIENILHDAHQNVAEGHGSEEEQKQDEHYISHIDEDQDDQSHSMNSDQDEMENYASDDDFDYNPEDFHESDADDQPDDFNYNPENDEENDESEEMSDNYALHEEGEDQEDDQQESEDMSEDAEDEDSSDEFSSDGDYMQSRVNNVIGNEESEEDQGSQEEEPIEIPESDKMESEQDLDTQEEPLVNEEDQDQAEMDTAEEDPSLERDAFNDMMSDAGQDVAKMKSQVAQALASFKEQKDQLVAIQQQAPELYEATLGMLQTMLDLSKALFGGGEEAQPQDEQATEEEDSPDISSNIPDEYAEQASAPKF